jgi:hypothetical protein
MKSSVSDRSYQRSQQTGNSASINRIEAQFEVNEQRVLVVTVKDLLKKKVLVEKGAIAKLK